MRLRWKAAVLLALTFALYFFTRSDGLDEWDSVQFAMGVRHFDLWLQQPHPPGYPLYIFSGWLGGQLFHWDPALALHIASALGGALLIVAWFLIIRLQFNERFAWLVTATFAVTPIVWMTATKVLTDSLADGLLSFQLFYALLYRQNARNHRLFVAVLLGAAAVGVRPQLIAVAVVILATPLWQRRASSATWVTSLGGLVIGCLTWLIPMWYLQARLRPTLPFWLVYPKQIFKQWSWRFDKPNVFVGAHGFGLKDFGLKLLTHFFGWYGVGFGFIYNYLTLALGTVLAIVGTVSYFRRLDEQDRAFWKRQWPWAAMHVAIIFCCLPPNQRYYLMIMPLLLVILLRGLLRLPRRLRSIAVSVFPILLLATSLPLASQSHRQEAPPIRFVRYLQTHTKPNERSSVLLILTECERPVQWYAPEFPIISHVTSLTAIDPVRLQRATAIYTDDPKLILPTNWRLQQKALFQRSLLISPKHRRIGVYKIVQVPVI